MSRRDLSQQTPSLFDSLPPLVVTEEPAKIATEEPVKEEKGAPRLAKDFVRWCFGFGPGFRNSPDITNLRYWAQKSKLKLKPGDESRLLRESRELFDKRLEVLMKKPGDPVLDSS